MKSEFRTSGSDEQRACEACGESSLTRSLQKQRFVYGSGASRVELEIIVPVWSCEPCGESFTDSEGEELRHEAVCIHLNRLTPRELQGIRTKLGKTQEAFAELTGFGVASIKRWESGNQIQTLSADRYIRLLSDHNIAAKLNEAISPRLESQPAKFRTTISHHMRLAALNFQLAPNSVLQAA